MSDRQLEFRPMLAGDLRLLHNWLQRPHVKRWWGEPRTPEQVVEHYLPSIEGRDPTDHYLVLLDGRPVGMVQTYLVSDYPKHAELMGISDSATAGVDILIGEAELIGEGLGTAILERFVSDVVFARPTTASCIADPDVANVASVRAFEKAGFHVAREFYDPKDGQTRALVRLDRPGTRSAPSLRRKSNA
jgi:RimJ/RimL family protein N-acetyltransferase